VQLLARVAVVGCGLAPFLGQRPERVALAITQLTQALREIVAVPEQLGPACQLLEPDDVERLDDDHHPGGQRHGEQQQHNAAGDPVPLVPDVDQAELRFHGDSFRKWMDMFISAPT
jgi:hypothetical protein